ncbi:hypothetical protein PC9H_000611 [Pleurotus ostreatus]|uniref:Uncharacterized protein n=1 Tax=Pleurotus ostreatus TaxID=5322 RepID=A0A8H7A538_PLEOS|nr:uncharacterized protein PC9H_000611 [Pleurotus ostreatus]KAF7440267.1 hypothetical protein PC9H_000611 [Pleurotus ostreatus]KAJ8700437.1 hypothetical protein PTI98_003460 [Pleurotus ostreatus]
MSIETPESPSRSLVVRIPRPSSTSSTDSPLASSPSTSILTFPNASTSSSSSSSAGTPPTATLSVKFAPLPDLSKRKKKYHHPLGVSARSDIMRRRRAAAEGNDYSYRDMANNSTDQQQQQPSAPAWSEEDAKVEERYRGRHRSSRRRNVMGDEEDELLEDPLITLGRMVKGASKSLWRKVANKRGDAVGGSEGDSEGGKVAADGEDIPAGTVDDPLPAAPELNEATTTGAQRPRKQSSASAKGLRDRKQSSGSVVDIRLPPHPVSRKASLDSSM